MTVKRPVVGASGLLLQNDAVLLVKRGYPPSAGQWAAPGGKVEWGEPLEVAMVREVAEETGLRVVSQGLLRAFESVERDQNGEIANHFIIHVYRCGLYGDREEAVLPRPADDAVEVRFVPLAELPRYEITRTTLKALRIAGVPIDGLVDFRVRPAEAGDAPLVQEILRRAFAAQQARLTYNPGSLRESEADIVADIAASTVWIGLFRGRPVATGRLRPQGDIGYVARLGVDREYQGLGIGRRMLSALEERARGLGLVRVTLKTSEMMIGNEEFYRSCGYMVTDRRENELRHIFMEKPLL